jgi:eukaryotic-like serine/threonine-protein kinase
MQLPCPVQPGEIIARKYQVESILGSGGVGVVVAARHVQLGERVALKFLHPEAASSTTDMARFLREARAAVRLKNEHAARVIDVGTLENGCPFIVMEFLTGTDLGVLLDQVESVPPMEAADYVLQACEAVAEAHALGIVHRDLKPSNLFLTERADGSPLIKVLDFGIAKATIEAELGAGDLELTKTRTVLGSPMYMSPEQVRSSKSVDQRSDIWSLGIVLYELLSGTVPFDGDTATGVVAAVLSDPPPPLLARKPDLPHGLVYAVERCLQKQREHRFQNVAELAEALLPFAPEHSRLSVSRIAGTLGIKARATSSLARLSHPSTPVATATTIKSVDVELTHRFGRIRLLSWGLGGAVVIALCGMGAWRFGGRPQPAAAASPVGSGVPSLHEAGLAASAVVAPPPASPPSVTPASAPQPGFSEPRAPASVAEPAASISAVRALAVPKSAPLALPSSRDAGRAAPPRGKLIDETVDTRK